MEVPEFEYSRIDELLWAGRNPLFKQDVEELAALGIRRIVDLREPWEWTAPRYGEEALAALEESGIQRFHVQIEDMGTPGAETLTRAVGVIRAGIEAGEPVYVHCRAGRERTGVVLVAWRASTRGESYDEALAALRLKRPELNPLPWQRAAVEEWLGQRRGGASRVQPRVRPGEGVRRG